MTLDELRVGQKARIVNITLGGGIGQRLLDMGFVEGTCVKIVRNAPLVDPIDLLVRGYHVSIRRAEAEGVEVEPL